MTNFMISESNYLSFCTEHYKNPHLLDIEEFENDLKTLRYIKSLFRKYISGNSDIKVEMLINHFIYVHNCFGDKMVDICFYNFEDYYYSILKTMLLYLKFLSPETKIISVNNKYIHLAEIPFNIDFYNKISVTKHRF